MNDKLQSEMKFLRGVAERNRLCILLSLKDGEKTVGEITEFTASSQSNISQHLACLKGCGMIKRRQEGKYCYYSLSGTHMLDFLNMLDVLMDKIGTDVSCCELDTALISRELNE
ncbi:MAG: ArsR/SmtB family transcription factor [Vibrio hibernica]